MKKQIFLLILILFIAGFLRFWQLGQVPASPDWDEVSLGYNAYSLLQTGCDEYDQRLPLFLRSFNDYKPALYAYLVIPFINLFGLNVFAVRLPAAILGTLAVLLTYWLVKEMFSRHTSEEYFAHLAGVTTAFLLAISPWHIQFSRVAFESNIGLFFNILWVLLFLKGLRRPWLLIFASFFSGLNLYVYQAEKVFTPLLVLTMILIWRKKLLRVSKKYLALSLITGLIVCLPFIYSVFTKSEIFLRAKGTSFLADQTPFLAQSTARLIRNNQNNNYLGLIFDNRRVTYVKTFINGYLSHFDLNWLFLTGDEARHHAPGMGLLYLWELPFLLIGIYQLIFKRFNRKIKLTIFSWFLLAPIPAAFTTGVPHAVRTLRFLPMIQIFVALGIVSFWQAIIKKPRPFYSLFSILYSLFIVFNFSYYLNQYFVQQNYFNSQSWQYGYQSAVESVKKIESNYQKIIVSNQAPLDQSHMFFLFYLKFDPLIYQKSGTNRGFSKYVFKSIKWDQEEKSPEILYVGRPKDFPENFQPLKTVYFLNNEPTILIGEI